MSKSKNVTWADDDYPGLPEESDGLASRASLSNSLATPVSKTFTLVKNVALVGRIFSWWNDTAESEQASTMPSQTLPVSKELPAEDGLNELTMSELIDNLEYRSRPRLNPVWQGKNKPATRHDPEGLTGASHRNANGFIRSDPKGQIQELRTELQLARAENCWINHDYKTMVDCSMKALELSEELGNIEYTAKVCFYVAIAHFGLGDFAGGRQFLKNAEKCKGVFREGDLIDWARAEAMLYEKRIEKKRASPRRQNTDGPMNYTSEAPSPVTAGIPGRTWRFRNGDIDRNQGKAPKFAPLSNEIGGFDVQDG